MSQQLRQLKSRIRSVEGTWKVTRAMEMVAMSKYKAVEGPLEMTRAYFEKLETMVYNLVAANEESASHPFLRKSTGGPIGLLIITSETGLCGVYNDQVIKQALKFMETQKAREIRVYAVGRKGASAFRAEGMNVAHAFPAFHGRLKSDFHSAIYKKLEADFVSESISEVHVAYTQFINAMKQQPKVTKLLGIDVPANKTSNFIIESGEKGVIGDVVPMYASNKLRLLMLESFTSEHSARMVAMKAAKDNAKELMGDLVLQRNKIRQASITKEVIEIISSAEALKG